MKIHVFILGAIVVATSCNSKPQPQTDETNHAVADTTGLAAFQAMKAQNELGTTNAEEKKEEKSSSKAEVKKTSTANHPVNTSSTNSGSGNTPVNSDGTSPSETQQKKGWSKTAKGAVIGGVAGAAGGAVINKKNRAAGAVIGGVVGAGTGAVIGNEMDKKDGRH